jgi:hypothetical protein
MRLLPCLLAALSCCTRFASSSEPPAPGHQGEASDADVASDAGGSAVLECDGQKCAVGTEVCCFYRTAAGRRRGACAVGKSKDACAAATDEVVLVASECDDPTDCAPNLVCCHDYASSYTGPLACGGLPSFAACVGTEACKPCAQDAGTARIACDPKRGQCSRDLHCEIVEANTLIAQGYCAP